VTYAELDALANRAAQALRSLGVRPGDVVAASLPNDTDIVVAFHAAMRLGALWLGINTVLAPPEKAYMLQDSGAVLALGDETVATELAAGRTRVVAPDEWDDAVAASSAESIQPTPDPDAPAAIAYTSGTTGFPKGALHCQAGLVMPGAATVARRGWGPSLRKGDSFPLTILNMMTLTTLLTSQAGGVAIVMDRNDTASIVDWIRRERVTVWNGAPAHLHTMVRDSSIEPSDLSTLDEVWVGGGDCPDSLRDDFEARFGVRVTRTYGLTEAPALVCVDDLEGDRPPGTSGRPLDHIRLRADDGEILLSAAREGPWARKYRPLLRYWNRPEATASVLEGGELHTGDLGEIDAGGHLRILGRRSQLIVRGGANVYPAEVERVLAQAPGVAGCAVVGVPDDRLGERVGAVVETVLGERAEPDKILAHCRAALAPYKVPERLAFVDHLPRNQMGKVPRDALLELLSGRVAVSGQA
jgi:long-chain acyl-CoA synthetase